MGFGLRNAMNCRTPRPVPLGFGRDRPHRERLGQWLRDIFIAFSTANPGVDAVPKTAQVSMLSNRRIDDLFEATLFDRQGQSPTI